MIGTETAATSRVEVSSQLTLPAEVSSWPEDREHRDEHRLDERHDEGAEPDDQQLESGAASARCGRRSRRRCSVCSDLDRQAGRDMGSFRRRTQARLGHTRQVDGISASYVAMTLGANFGPGCHAAGSVAP